MSDDLTSTINAYKSLDQKRAEEGLSPDEEQAWEKAKDSIERSISEAEELPPSSRRSTLRVPSHLGVRFETAAGFYKAYLRNISEGGVYIATERELTLGNRFHITLEVKELEAELLLHVEVVWVNKNPSPGSGLDPGVGVAWLDLPPEDKVRIKALVHSALDELKTD
jgi:uncharacterized protein (TIGR02266 family)